MDQPSRSGPGPDGFAPSGEEPTAGFYHPWEDADRDYSAGDLPVTRAGTVGEVERVVLGTGRLVDRLQSRFAPVAFLYATFKKYADDEGSRLAALLAHYSFLSIFPLMIGGFAVLDMVLANRPETVHRLVTEIVPADYQEQVVSAYESLPASGPTLAVAIIGLFLAGTGGVFAFYAAVNQIYAVPYRHRYGFGPRYARVVAVVVLLGIGVLVVAVGSTLLGSLTRIALAQRLGGFGLTWLVGFGMLYVAAVILSRRPLGFAEVGLGAMLGSLLMTLAISLGSALLGRYIASSSVVYGAFATVVGIISVLFLVSNAVVFSFELSVVRAWQLWPRGVDVNVLFAADERALALLVIMDERMPSQRNGVAFDAAGHDDPRRPDPRVLQRRAPAVPRTPYDSRRGQADRDPGE